MSIAPAEWDRAVAAIEGARGTIGLACHVGPDGDALGSMLAVGLALRSRGIEVAASWGSEPFEVPAALSFLPGRDLLVPPARFPGEPAVLLTFDAGSLDRVGTLAAAAQKAGTLIVVDHHASNDRFGAVNLVDPDAAASAVIAAELLDRLQIPLDADVASGLYTGLVTDTGRFQHSNTTPAVHALAARLIAAGAPHVAITDRVYNTWKRGFLTLAGDALARLRERDGMVWTWVTQEDLARHGVGLADLDPLIDLVRTAEGIDVAAVLKQQPEGNYKVSMRSRAATDVGSICASFGGGGHRLAAGFTSEKSDPEAIAGEIAARLAA
ncbi:MAG TPA: bifunctional oligoribonuclease/PAP phosphatase NrnA [Actinomycetota bacterium]